MCANVLKYLLEGERELLLRGGIDGLVGMPLRYFQAERMQM